MNKGFENPTEASRDELDGRRRSGSLNNIDDFLKRKRGTKIEAGKSEKPVAEIFKKSKLLPRSPVKEKETIKGLDMEEIKELFKTMKEEIKEEIKLVREDNKELREEFKKERERWAEEKKQMKTEVEFLKNKINIMENQSRRENLVIRGIEEEAQESWDDCAEKVVEIGRKIGVEIKQEDISRAHRIGKGKDRPIVAKFNSWKIKESFLKKKSNLKGTRIVVMEDFSTKTINDRKHLYEEAKNRRMKGEYAVVRFDKLVTERGTFRWDNEQEKIQAIPNTGRNNATIGSGDRKEKRYQTGRQQANSK